ncbi:MAG TPA: SMC-Scp complex subunit ScpB [Candidatus Nanoarchaeia archaeon]|nr:SMC-Scp complex subunit ScpB [Candidatus Nanoarchaeia archaeon]
MNKKKVEAVLFTVGKEITTERLASLSSLEIKEVENIMAELVSEYAQRDQALKIEARDKAWKLTVKDEFIPLVSGIVTSTEMEKPLMDTLAVIAWKYPIVQSDIIKLRGSGAYEHMRELTERGFIVKEKEGRTFKVKLTPKFFEYFDLPSAEAKEAFLKLVPQEILNQGQAVEREADMVERLIELEQKEKEGRGEIAKATEQLKQAQN